MAVKVIGLDIAKSVFQVHGVNETGQTVLRRRLRRHDVLELFASIEPTLVGIEACHTGHYWAREIAALGHEVRLMPPQFVKRTSRARRTTQPTPKRFARPCSDQRCGSCRLRAPNSKQRFSCIVPETY